MSTPETPNFDPREFAAGITPPTNPYKGYDARQAELDEKDHPWANPVPDVGETDDPAKAARRDFHAAMHEEFRLTGPDTRSAEERERQATINAAGRAAVEAALAAAKAKRQGN